MADVVAAAAALPGVAQVVVVDHGSDGAADIAEGAGASVVRDESNPGFGAGMNHGVARTSAPAVLLLNPDAAMRPAAVAAGLDHLAGDASIAAVQGVIVNRGSGAPERSAGTEIGPMHLIGRAVGARRWSTTRLGRATAHRLGVGDHVDRVPQGPVDVENLAATALLIRRGAFDSVEGFDERYFLYGEDLDLCRRLRVAGWRLVALPEEWADHVSGGTAASAWERELTWWRGTMRFAAQWWPARPWRVALVAAAVRWARLVVEQPREAHRAWCALVSDPRADRCELER